MERKQKAELLKRVFAAAKSKNMKNKTNKQKNRLQSLKDRP